MAKNLVIFLLIFSLDMHAQVMEEPIVNTPVQTAPNMAVQYCAPGANNTAVCASAVKAGDALIVNTNSASGYATCTDNASTPDTFTMFREAEAQPGGYNFITFLIAVNVTGAAPGMTITCSVSNLIITEGDEIGGVSASPYAGSADSAISVDNGTGPVNVGPFTVPSGAFIWTGIIAGNASGNPLWVPPTGYSTILPISNPNGHNTFFTTAGLAGASGGSTTVTWPTWTTSVRTVTAAIALK